VTPSIRPSSMARKRAADEIATASPSLYAILGVSESCTPKALTRAWRRTALRLHPDKTGSDAAFKAAQEAYDVLKDPERRAYYDRSGEKTPRKDIASWWESDDLDDRRWHGTDAARNASWLSRERGTPTANGFVTSGDVRTNANGLSSMFSFRVSTGSVMSSFH